MDEAWWVALWFGMNIAPQDVQQGKVKRGPLKVPTHSHIHICVSMVSVYIRIYICTAEGAYIHIYIYVCVHAYRCCTRCCCRF